MPIILDVWRLEQALSAKVRAFIDALGEHMKADQPADYQRGVSASS